jgi:hypothetical protein
MQQFMFSFATLNARLAKHAKAAKLTRNDLDQPMQFRVATDGAIFDIKNKDGEFVMSRTNPGEVLQEKRWRVDAINLVAMQNPRNLELLQEGKKLEAAGELEKAHECYNTFYNRVVPSIQVLLPLRPNFEDFGRGDRVRAVPVMLTPEEDGVQGDMLKLIDPRPVGAIKAAGIKDFSLEMLLQEPETPGGLDDLINKETEQAQPAASAVAQ